MKSSQIVLALASVSLVASVGAATVFQGGNLNSAASWDNGLPAPGNVGTIATNGTNGSTVFNFGDGSIVNHMAGTITSADGFNVTNGTWNLSGGMVVTRYLLSNGQNGPTVFNLSGGTVVLADVTGTQHMGVGNGGTFNISGSVVLDGTQATVPVQVAGTVDIATGWTGSWTWGIYVGTEWETHFTSGEITLDGAIIDKAAFDSNFFVTDGGRTLSMQPPAVLPTAFNGGDLLASGNWTNGLPVDPVQGSVAVDGAYDDGNSGTADWLLTMTAGTITAGQDWNFGGASTITIRGGTLNVTGDILSSDDTSMNISGGAVSWGGKLAPAGTPGGTINITGGILTGNSTPATSFGNAAGGTVIVTGGEIMASTFDFAAGTAATLGGNAILSGDTATFGVLDIRSNWSGGFTLTSFSDTDWEEQFTLGNITLGGETLDAAGFDENFSVSDFGQTLTRAAGTVFLGGDLNAAGSWSNGLPAADNPGSIAVDGSNGTTVFGFGGAAVVEHTAGTITSSDGFNFIQGDIWNLTGGQIVTRYFLSNGQNGPTVLNLSGGSVVLADVAGNQHMGSGNNGIFNVSGSVVLDGTQATLPVQIGGTVDIASDWTGSWTWGIYSGSEWRDHFVNGEISVDGAMIDASTFDSMFQVTDGGQTLSMNTGAGALKLIITNDGANLDFAWDSRPGVYYVLSTSTDLAADFSTWASVDVPGSVEVDGVYQIPTNPPLNEHSILRPGDAMRFYRVEEFALPPVTVFSDDFEAGAGDWSAGSDGAAGTTWELGVPANVGPSAAHSPLHCFGSNIEADYDFNASIWLRSPAIDLTMAAEATLRYWQFADIEEGFDLGTVVIVDATDGSELAVIDPVIDGITPDWEEVTQAIPAEGLGQVIKLEFRFESDDIGNFAGWYIDDVIVTTPAP